MKNNKCTHCGAELEKHCTVCPECGQEVIDEDGEAEEKKEVKTGGDKKLKILLVVLASLVLVLLVVLLVLLIVGGREKSNADPSTGSSGSIVGTVPADGNPDDETCKGTYIVEDDILNQNVDTVVAEVGDAQLTVGVLQVYYWGTVRDFISNYSSYLSTWGLDYTKPLNTQICSLVTEKSVTWEQYFLSEALTVWKTYQVMAQAAEAADFEMSEEYQTFLEELPETLAERAENDGFESVDEMLQAELGSCVTYEDYREYLRCYYLGYEYYVYLGENAGLTNEEIEAYFTENETMFAYYGITKDSGKEVNVRHILITPEEDTEAGWEACRAEAQRIYDLWQAGDMDEDSFAELAVEYSKCGSAANGGLLDPFGPGEMVEEFEDWSINQEHKYGDHGLIRTRFGWHIMFFVDGEEIWIKYARSGALTAKSEELMATMIEEADMTVYYENAVLGDVSIIYTVTQ